jgi:2,3-bisphosphoglycerate-dependent phosphoglycerate mutase
LADIFVVRHGETDWNLAQRFQGHTDIPLNAKGERQAELLAARLADEPIEAIYTSDLKRAHATAEASAQRHGLQLRIEPGLRERNFGVFEGHTFSEIAARFPDEHRRWSSREPDFSVDGGESLLQVSTRIAAVLDSVAGRHAEGCILLVTHGGALDIIYRRVLGIDLHQPREWPTPNAAVNHLRFVNGRWQMVAWADEEHLR